MSDRGSVSSGAPKDRSHYSMCSIVSYTNSLGRYNRMPFQTSVRSAGLSLTASSYVGDGMPPSTGEGMACQNNNSGSALTLLVVLPYAGGGFRIGKPLSLTWVISGA